MAAQYEIKDTNNPSERGQRFSTEERARKALAKIWGAPKGRYALVNRETKEVVATN